MKRIEDPIGLLPGRIVLGVNPRGVHFFRPTPMAYLHSAELRDIMQFGSSENAVFFKMRVAGVMHVFQFETRGGEEVCVALQTHINDVMTKRHKEKKLREEPRGERERNQNKSMAEAPSTPRGAPDGPADPRVKGPTKSPPPRRLRRLRRLGFFLFPRDGEREARPGGGEPQDRGDGPGARGAARASGQNGSRGGAERREGRRARRAAGG